MKSNNDCWHTHNFSSEQNIKNKHYLIIILWILFGFSSLDILITNNVKQLLKIYFYKNILLIIIIHTFEDLYRQLMIFTSIKIKYIVRSMSLRSWGHSKHLHIIILFYGIFVETYESWCLKSISIIGIPL